MTETTTKMTLREAREHFIKHHRTRLNELAELDLKKEYAAAIVIAQDLLTAFNHIYVASHFEVAHEYFLDIEHSIENSVDGIYPVFPQLEQLKMFMEAAGRVGVRKQQQNVKPLLDQLAESIRSAHTDRPHSAFRSNHGH